jgi:FAD/FMN-containing dehydrogenase
LRRLRSEPLRTAGAGLTRRSPDFQIDLPPDLGRHALFGGEAADRASLVSGPFRASPKAYLTPGDEESLARTLAWAWEHRVGIIPRGGGTGMPGGNLGPHLVLELGRGFDRVELLEADGSRIRAGAGAVAGVVDRIARERGRFLPFLPSSSQWCRVGGMVGTNAGGARSFRHGATHRWVDAVEGFFAWGEPFRAERGASPAGVFSNLLARLPNSLSSSGGAVLGWPNVRKNSSGYALDRFLPGGDALGLLVGSEGTLAVFTHVELRTAPLPEATGLALFVADSADELTAVAEAASDVDATACEFFGRRFLELGGAADAFPDIVPQAWALALVEVSGSEGEVQDRLARLGQAGGRPRPRLATRDPEEVDRLWGVRHRASPAIAHNAPAGLVSTQFVEDSVVPPPALGRYLDGLERILADARLDAVVFGHAGDANVHANALLDLSEPDWLPRARSVLDGVTELVRALGGTLSGEHGDGRLRAPLVSRIWTPPIVKAFREVKNTLDPHGILNPGAVIPLKNQDPFEGFAPRPRAFPP